MKRVIVSTVFIVAALLVLQGCTQRIGDFTLISTKNVDIGGKYKKMDGRFTAADTKIHILMIPLGVPDLKQAVDNCIQAGKGDLLTNAVIESGFWSAIVYGEQKYTVVADVWAIATMGDLMDSSIELYELRSGQGGYELVSTLNPENTVKVDYFTSR